MLNDHELTDFLNEDYRMLESMNDSTLFIDVENQIVKILWVGEVDELTASFLLTKAANEIEAGNATKILLNRKFLSQFTTEARKWIKEDLLRGRAKTLVHQVDKVATVKSSTSMGNLFATLVSSSIKIVFPNLNMSRFDTEIQARKWLLS